MTNHRALIYSFFTVAIALSMAAPAAAQSSECQPDDLFCAELRIGPGRAGVRIGPADAPPPPPPAQPPTVIVEPGPPPAPPPQPPTVIVQPAPPPPPPQPHVVRVEPVEQPRVMIRRERRERRERRFPYSAIGPHIAVGGLVGPDLAMMGGSAALRIRPVPHFALDVGAGLYFGNDYNDLERTEVPLTVDALFFFNPQHRFQFYALVGVGGSISHAEGVNRFTLDNVSRDYGHLGAQAGLGIEWRISRLFALNFDVRAFIRHRVDESAEPEFMELDRRGEWQSTDTSAGLVGQLGMTFYFGE